MTLLLQASEIESTGAVNVCMDCTYDYRPMAIGVSIITSGCPGKTLCNEEALADVPAKILLAESVAITERIFAVYKPRIWLLFVKRLVYDVPRLSDLWA